MKDWALTSIFLFTICAGLLFGSIPVKNSNTGKKSSRNIEINRTRQVSLRKILVNNFTVACLVLLGSITYGFIGLVMVFHSAYVTSIFLFSFALDYGLKYSLALLLPHGIIELVWLYLLFKASVKIGGGLFSYLNNGVTPLNQIIYAELRRSILVAITLILVSGLIETYLSKEVANLIVN